jgi:hypothetical protein
MAYRVRFTEQSILKPALQVVDQALNSQTDLTFVGKDYGAYAPVIAENFLHLLENFANASMPAKPVEGQLWFDTSSTARVLKVFDGNSWTPVGSVKKAPTAPEINNSSDGDLWVDTSNKQLYILNGSSWILIGPNFSNGVKTGPLVETFTDLNNTQHAVVSQYANNKRISIVSNETFIPNTIIENFPVIYKGITMQNASSYTTTIFGTASNAKSLIINNKVVDASVFVRTDTPNVLTQQLAINSNDGIIIGSQSEFNIGTNSVATVLSSNASNKHIQLKVKNDVDSTVVLHIDSTNKLGINTETPEDALDVNGNTIVRGSLTVNSDQTINGNLYSSSAAYMTDLIVNGRLVLNSQLDGNFFDGSVITPGYDTNDFPALYDIGSATSRFRNVYADTFIGSFNGTITGDITGNVSGTAQRLATATNFLLSGDVSSDAVAFDGSQSSITFATSIVETFITNKPEITQSAGSNELIVYVPDTGLQKITKQNLLADVSTVLIGTIITYAGNTIPEGYLLCNGAEISQTTYSSLFSSIRHTYKAVELVLTPNSFGLPDLEFTANTNIKYLIFAGV